MTPWPNFKPYELSTCNLLGLSSRAVTVAEKPFNALEASGAMIYSAENLQHKKVETRSMF